MTQIKKKFIESNAVDGTKIRLNNDQFLRARNAANSADVNVLKVDASDTIQFPSVPEVSSDPSSANGLVRKSYVDNLLNGLKWKNPVRAASTGNLTLSGAQTVDGVSLIAGDRLLAKDQTDPKENGIYVVAAGAYTRAIDADAGSELVSAAVFASEGTVNADKGFTCSTDAPITIGVTNISFIQFTSAGSYTAGNGINITSSTISVALDTNPGLEFNSAALRVKINAAGALTRDANGLAVKVDSATTKINASNQIEGLKRAESIITLNSTDITNQYIDLSRVAASAEGIVFYCVGGPIQTNTIDYTVSLTGGAGSNTRISFAGDLATAGAAALVSGDILVVKFEYL
jgi:hypothetical protein